MQRLLVLSAIALLVASGIAFPASAVGQNGTCSLPNGDTTPPFEDRCFHQGVWFSPHTTDVDVIIVPSQSAYALRDIQAVNEVVDMWELGIKNLGAPWLVEGLHVNDYTVGYEYVPPSALADPEVVVAVTSEVFPPGSYLGMASLFGALLPCHGIQVPADASQGLHRHEGSPIGSFQGACAGGGTVCWVTNFASFNTPSAENLRMLYDLVAHEVGHCLSLGHVGDADTESTDDSVAYPEHDIMSYENDGIHASRTHCVSNLNVRVLEKAYAYMLAQPGATTAVAPNPNGYAHMYPEDWEAPVCPESTANATDPTYVLGSDPTRTDTDEAGGGGGGGDEEPVINISSPGDGDTIGEVLTVVGSVAFEDEDAEMSASAGGPYSGLTSQAIAITGTGAHGTAPYSCSWSGAGATFAAANQCGTTVTFATAGSKTITVTVTDSAAQSASAQATVTVTEIGAAWCVEEPTSGTPAGLWDLTKLCLSVQGSDLVGVLHVADLSALATHDCAESPATWGFWLTGQASGPVEVYCFMGAFVSNWAGGSAFDTTGTVDIDYAAGTITVHVPLSEFTNLALPATGWGESWNGPGAYGGRPMWLGGQVADAPLYADRVPDGALPTDMSAGRGLAPLPLGAVSRLAPGAAGLQVGSVAPASFLGLEVYSTSMAVSDPAGETPAPFYDLRSVAIANEDADSFDVVITVADLGSGVPSNPLVGFSYQASFCTNNNLKASGQPFCYRLTADNTVGTGAAFDGSIIQGNGSDACGLEGLVTGGSFNDPANTIRWTVAKAQANVKATGQAIADCPPAGAIDRTGRGIQDGDLLTALSASTGTRVGPKFQGTELSLTTSAGSDTAGPDTAAYEFGGDVVEPLGEHVLVEVGGLMAEVAVDSSSGSDTWQVTFDDLTGLEAGTYDLVATWFDAEGNDLDSATVTGLVIGEVCNAPPGEDCAGGGINNVAPVIDESSFQLLTASNAPSDGIVEENGAAHALKLRFDADDANGAEDIAPSQLVVEFLPAGSGITADLDNALAPIVAGEVQFTVPISVPSGITPGKYGVRVTVKDGAATPLQDVATFANRIEAIPAGTFVVNIGGGGAGLRFPTVNPEADDVEALNYVVLTNHEHEAHDFAFYIGDFANLDTGKDCLADLVDTTECLRFAGNMDLLVSTTKDTNGNYVFTDAAVISFTGAPTTFVTALPDGAAVAVKPVIREVGELVGGKYGSTFSVTLLE